MNLYLIRHADAVPLGEGGIEDDAERPLTDAGKAQCAALAKALAKHGVQFDAILTSPLLRARQTAEEILKAWTVPATHVHTCDDLALGGRRKRISRAVEDLKHDSVGLVGHQPDMCEYAAWLIGSRKVQVDLAKAGVAYIQCADRPAKGTGTLIWLVTPVWFGAK